MRRLLKLLILVLALVAVLAGASYALLQNEGFLKSRIATFVEHRTGRALSLDGPLKLQLGRAIAFEARELGLANADGLAPPDMLRIGRLRVVLDLPALWRGDIVLADLQIENCRLDLAKDANGTANWQDIVPQPKDETEPDKAPSIPEFHRARIEQCRFSYLPANRENPLVLEIDTLEHGVDAQHRASWNGSGRLENEPWTLSGSLAPLHALSRGGAMEHELELDIGRTRLVSSGSFEDLFSGTGADLEVNFSGPDIGRALETFLLPPISEGEFNFRANLDTRGGQTQIDVEGDLGSMNVRAQGQLNRLRQPDSGSVQLSAKGPDLGAMATLFGVPGLVPEPYSVNGEVSFDRGAAEIPGLTLTTDGDKLEVSGTIGAPDGYAGSDVTVQLESNDLARWAGRLGLPDGLAGTATLSGRIVSDATGQFTTETRFDLANSAGRIEGPLGKVGVGLRPDIHFTLEAADAEKLGAALGAAGLPAAPLSAGGRLGWDGSLARLDAIRVDIGDHQAVIDGSLAAGDPWPQGQLSLEAVSPDLAALGRMFGAESLPAAPLKAVGRIVSSAGNVQLDGWQVDLKDHRALLRGTLEPGDPRPAGQLAVELKSPDLGALGSLLGVEGLPAEAVTINASLDSDGRNLRFLSQQGQVGSLRLDFDGEIPDLARPLALGMDFDVAVPSLTAIHAFAPRVIVPDLPFGASGSLRNDNESTRLENVQLTLGDMTGELSGNLANAQQFDVQLAARGPDASALAAWTKDSLEAKPFTLDTRIAGNFSGFEFSDIRIQLGDSDASGRLRLDIRELVELSGEAHARRLDLAYWGDRFLAEEEATGGAAVQQWVFDDSPIANIRAQRVRLDLDVRAEVVQLPATFLRGLELGIHLSPRRLELKPVSFKGQNEGQTTGSLVLNSGPEIPELEAKVHGEAIRMGFLAAKGRPITEYPPTDIDLVLSAKGATNRAMAESLDGRLRLGVGAGKVASLGARALFSDFLTELLTLLNPFAAREDFTQLECAFVAADSVNGQITIAPLVLQTDALTTLSEGTVDLGTEQIGLSFQTKARKGLGISATALINPVINVSGPLASPSIDLDTASAVVSGGVAVATAGLSILARTVGDRLLSSQDPCGDAKREISERDGQQENVR